MTENDIKSSWAAELSARIQAAELRIFQYDHPSLWERIKTRLGLEPWRKYCRRCSEIELQALKKIRVERKMT
jgi:hypothetical protein